jgi:hypothetical protein
MGHANGKPTESEQVERGDQRQGINMQGRFEPGLCSLIAWGWNWCLFFDDSGHHKLTLDEGTKLVKSQLTLLCQVQARLSIH